MVKLGLKSEQVVLGPHALEEYNRLFTMPLSQLHVAALATLFGWQVLDSDQALKEAKALVGLVSLEAWLPVGFVWSTVFVLMDLSKVLIWNVRGLNRKARRDVVCDMVGSTRPNIVFARNEEGNNFTSHGDVYAWGWFWWICRATGRWHSWRSSVGMERKHVPGAKHQDW
jgi:hypothetical protein